MRGILIQGAVMTDPEMKEVDLFHFDEDRPSIEDLSRQNGMLYWMASMFMKELGYAEYSPKLKPIQKAIQVCISLNIEITEHFQEDWIEVDGKRVKDLKLSRFACYLISMNAD